MWGDLGSPVLKGNRGATSLVDGLHEAIIPEGLFWRVQERFARRLKAGKKAKFVEELALRGHLLCPECRELLTGSASRGRSRRYRYYHCHRCQRVRYRAGEVRERFSAYLAGVQVAPEVRVLYERVLGDLASEGRQARERRLLALNGQIEALEERLFRADEAFIESMITPESYARLKAKYEAQLRKARLERSHLEEGAVGSNLPRGTRLFWWKFSNHSGESGNRPFSRKIAENRRRRSLERLRRPVR